MSDLKMYFEDNSEDNPLVTKKTLDKEIKRLEKETSFCRWQLIFIGIVLVIQIIKNF